MHPIVPYAGAAVGLVAGAVIIRALTAPKGLGPIVTIVMENHNRAQVMGVAPYLTELARSQVDLTNYRVNVQPSLPGYILMTSGTTAGIIDDTGYVIPGDANLAGQMDAAGISWRSYAEGSSGPCDTRYHGRYMPRHVPWLYYENVVGRPDHCAAHVVPLEPYFWDDLARGDVRFMFVTPDSVHDMHDAGVGPGDAWLASFVPRVMASPAFQRGGVLFVVFDERWGGSNILPAVIASPRLRAPGVPYAGPTGHEALLATWEDLLGLPRLPVVAGVESMAGLIAV